MQNVRHLRLWVTAICAFLTFGVTAQNAAHSEPVWKTLRRLVQSKDSLAKDSLRTLLPQLMTPAASEIEMTWAARGYYVLGEKKTCDSINDLIPAKFPNGVMARNKAGQAIYGEKDLPKKLQAYYQWIKKFPPSNFPEEDHDHVVYDYVLMQIAHAYAEKGDVPKAEYWINKAQEDFYFGNSYGSLAETFKKLNNLPMAEKYYKKAMLSAKKYYDDSLSKDNAVRFAGSGYPGLLNSYTDVLTRQKKYAEALPWAKKAMALSKEPNSGAAFNYAMLLKSLHRYNEAYNTLEPVIKDAKGSPEMVDSFKVLYVKVKGSDSGYAAYSEAIHKAFIANLHVRLAKDEVKQPSVDFTLTDVNGRQVSLSDYRGKVVVLDFWATWCGPCKASFPAMKMAQEKYKEDDSVKFLFIHTWERDTSATKATADAKAYVDDNHYPFEVLMDLKNRDSAENLVAARYKLTGIPAKFVIDKNGNIRFRLTGFQGSPEAAAEELSMMIEIARRRGNAAK